MPGHHPLVGLMPMLLACAYLAGGALLIALPRSVEAFALAIFAMAGVLLPLYACQFSAGFLFTALRPRSHHALALLDWRFLRAVYRYRPREGEREVWSLFLFAHPLALGTVPVVLGVMQKG